jgi:hypothetical protein
MEEQGRVLEAAGKPKLLISETLTGIDGEGPPTNFP